VLHKADLYVSKSEPKEAAGIYKPAEYGKKNLSDDMVLAYEDESHIRDYQALRATWFEKGKQKKIPTYGHHASVNLFGAVNALDGDFFCMQATRCNAQAFERFLAFTLQRYPDKKVIMVLDNSRIHHARILRPFLEKNKERLYFLFLPPYSPNLNKVERMWQWLREKVIVNRFHKDRTAIQESIDSFLDFVKREPKQVLKRISGLNMSKA
jgi:transposase